MNNQVHGSFFPEHFSKKFNATPLKSASHITRYSNECRRWLNRAITNPREHIVGLLMIVLMKDFRHIWIHHNINETQHDEDYPIEQLYMVHFL